MLRVVGSISRAATRAQAGVRLASGHGHGKSAVEVARESRVTLNDMPVPSGSWQENYRKRNAKWNLLLAVSAGVFVATAFAVWKNDVMYLHGQPDLKSVTINVK